jgi:uncharacterized membrane protein YjjB (DUF3815 family)
MKLSDWPIGRLVGGFGTIIVFYMGHRLGLSIPLSLSLAILVVLGIIISLRKSL